MGDAVASHVLTGLLIQSEERLRALVEHSGEAIMVIDFGTQRLVEVNRPAEELLGWPTGQLLGVEVDRLSPELQGDGRHSDERITEILAEVGAGEVRGRCGGLSGCIGGVMVGWGRVRWSCAWCRTRSGC